jgi:hypothetical protein
MPNLVKVNYEQTRDIKKVIVAVPERSIGGAFGTTDLKSYGSYVDRIRK